MNPRFYFNSTRKAAASIYGDGCSSIHVILELWVVLFSGSILAVQMDRNPCTVIFRKMKGISKKDLVQARYAKELNLRKSHMAEVKAELSKATETLNVLRAEIVRGIQGESAFSQDTLAGLIRDSEAKCSELQTQYEEAEAAVLSEEQLLNHLTDQYEELISWADLYDHATFEAKKMIVNCMIR